MELDSHIILSLNFYKITSLLVGCVFAYMSYAWLCRGSFVEIAEEGGTDMPGKETLSAIDDAEH